MNEEHVWEVGDLCTYVSPDNTGWGVLYRVEWIESYESIVPKIKGVLLNLFPVTAIFFSTKKRKRMKLVEPSRCTYMSLVDLATAYANFGLFIAEEAKRKGT